MRKLAWALVLVMALAMGAQAEQLVVSTWGFGEDIFTETTKIPFEELTGAAVVYDFGNNADRVNKIRMFKNNPQVDVVQLAHYFSQMLVDEGLVEPLDVSKLENWDKLHDVAKSPTGEGYGPAYTVSRLGIVYRADKVIEPITSWKDLWREDLQGFIAWPELSTTQGPMALSVLGDVFGEDFYDIDTAFEKINELRPGIVKFYNNSSELINMFERGEVYAAPTLHLFLGGFARTGLDIAWCDPEDGVVANFNTINIVKNAPNKELAYKYVDFMLAKEIQYQNAVKLGDSPVNREVELTPEEAAALTYGPEVIDQLITLDWDFILANLDSWLDRWNRDHLRY